MIRAGVIGWPVAHSLSPVLHGYWLKEYGIDGEMVRLPAEPEKFAAEIDRVRGLGFAGVNVTVPHKEAAFAIAHSVDVAAQRGAPCWRLTSWAWRKSIFSTVITQGRKA